MSAARTKEWFDEEAFWRDFYLFMFSEKRFAEAAEQIEKLLKLVPVKGKAVLDLCCGPGRFCIPLAKRGLRVTGVDKTQFLLRKGKAKARSAHVRVEWVQADMRDFVRPNSFNLALSMFTSFGYFEKKDEDLAVLANVYRCLHEGGKFVIDVMGKEVLARIAQPSWCDVLPDGSKLVQRPEPVNDWTQVRNEWILIRDGEAKTFTFHNRIYSGQELRERLEQAGFTDVKLYGSLDGDAYGLNAKRLIAVATK